MPTRIVREGILSSETVNSLTDSAELFYRRLMSVTDDYGRYYAAPMAIHGVIWTLKASQKSPKFTKRLLSECVAKRAVFLYGDGKYLVVPKLWQQIRAKSKFPEPPLEFLRSGCTADSAYVPKTDKQPLNTGLTQSESEAKAKTKAYAKSETQPESLSPPVSRLPLAGSDADASDSIKVALAQGVAAKLVPAVSTGDVVQDLKGMLSSLYRRPCQQAWSYLEQSLLAEIARRPDALAEFQIIVNFRRGMPPDERKKFFPQSLSSLLEKWNGILDRARMNHRPAAPIIAKTVTPNAPPMSEEFRARAAEELKKLKGEISSPAKSEGVTPIPDTRL